MKASVLMSIYNETEDEICASVMSILKQSFNDFELIIVHDNPANENKLGIVEWLKKLDPRISVIENDVNIGLAMSMNKAFDIAAGKYIIRMDSDDICEPSRFEREIELLETQKWDLVFTNYTLIDSNGNSLNNGKKAIKTKEADSSLVSEIIFDGIIHHPTVAMTRDIFIKTGGYRDFPCSQDLDLWLRMIDCNCRFVYLNEPLLKYRIRENSVTGRNKLKQQLTIIYIINLFKERIKKGYDSYLFSKYEEFIKSKITEKSIKNYAKGIEYLQSALETNSVIQRVILRVKAFCVCSTLRYSYINKKLYNTKIRKILEHQKKINISII